MKLSVDHQGDYTRLSFHGSLNMDEMNDIELELKQAMETAAGFILVNMAKVKYIDSLGTGMLVNLLGWCRDSDRQLILTELAPNILDIFHLTNLNRIFKITLTEQEALQIIYPSHIFLFDDREDIIFFYQEVLQANDLKFGHHGDIESALEALHNSPVDMLLIDALEQEEAKYELVRRMKQDQKLKNIPIVILSIHEDEEFQYSQFGVDRFILKPFQVEQFVATVKEQLANRKDE